MASSTMYPFLTQSELVLDNDQKIIPGAKIEVFDPVSNNHVNIYTYDSANDQYVIAQNPVYLDNLSRAQNSYFSDRLVLCMLYKYRGDFSDPLSDDDTENWQYVRNWLGSFSTKTIDDGNIVTGLSGLKAADTDRGSVTVVGYWTGDDCEARTYVWVSTSVATPDNGYIVKSDNSDTGRWILQFDGEYLPSTYYGVYPGKEANMNALLTFPAAIGSQWTAPGVYFKKGAYNASTTALTTSKKVLVDADTQFTRTSFTVADVNVIGHANHGVCDWIISDVEGYTSTKTVHSSWFRTIKGFWKSKARTLIIDQYNHFTNSTIDDPITIYKQNIVGNSYLSALYTGTGRLNINECSITGQGMFRINYDKISFYSMEIKSEWFVATSGYSTVGTNLIFSDSDNIIDLSNFRKTPADSEFYRAIQQSRGATSLDLQNRSIAGFTNTFSYIKNLSLTSGQSINITNNNASVTLDHVLGGYINVTGTNVTLHVKNGSIVNIIGIDNVSVLNVNDSTAGSQTTFIDASKTQLTAYNSTITATLAQSSANTTTRGKDIKLIDSNLSRTGANHSVCGKIQMKNTKVNQAMFFYPFLDGENHYWLWTEFQGCEFAGDCRLRYELLDFANQGATVHHIRPAIRLDSNKFSTSDPYGITMPMWTFNDATGNYPFLDPSWQVGGCYYRGNSGNCPKTWDSYFCLSNMNTSSDYDAVTGGYVTKSYNHRIWFITYNGTYTIGSALLEERGRGKAFTVGTEGDVAPHGIRSINTMIINSTSPQNFYGLGKTLSPAAYGDKGDMFDIRLFIAAGDWHEGDYVSLIPMGDFCTQKPVIN